MAKIIQIGKQMVSAERPPFIIAEAGVNHNGNINLAKKLVDVAAESGADYVKFQTFKAEKLASSIRAPMAAFHAATSERAKSNPLRKSLTTSLGN